MVDLSPKATWRPAPTPEAAELLRGAGLSPLQAQLLARRGILDAAGATAFLRPDLEQLHDPFLLLGMEPAVERLQLAAERGEKVAIVGDYDVDGVSATALLCAAFAASGIGTEAIVPHRMLEGYGFQPVHVERALEKGCSVVVTADCGTTSEEAIAKALDAGLFVIITDHHIPGPTLPSAAIQINPKQESCGYPYTELCGAGLALKLSQALLQRVGRKVDLQVLLRVACLGTVADMVPLTGENRAIASLGLKSLGETRSPGLRALMHQSGVSPPVMASDIGFRLGPRLNAAGRLGSADAALELLLCREHPRAAELAGQLDRWNQERKAEELCAVEEAREVVTSRSPLPPILVAWSERWHRGVVGIAAGRLAREFQRPAILFGLDGDLAVGSGRSVPGLDLHAFLDPWREQMPRFGGHSQAIGLTVPVADLEALREAWEQAASEWPQSLFEKIYEYELELSPREVTLGLLDELEMLEPFGQENPQPLLKVGPLTSTGRFRFFGKNHLSGPAQGDDGARVQLLGWRWQPRAPELRKPFEVLAYLERDTYRGGPVLRLVDSRPV